ncbi:MAG: hypothetical protein U9N35_01785 [Euryarchaeota archaeon]|nr:hypothetical protein [Euryarchaeota archaeon]
MEKRHIVNVAIMALVVTSLLCIDYSKNENVTHSPPKGERLTPHPGSHIGGTYKETMTVSAGDSVETTFWVTPQRGTWHLEYIGWSNEIYPFKSDVKPLSSGIGIEPEDIVIKKGESKEMTLTIKTSPELAPGTYWIQGYVSLEGRGTQVTKIKIEVIEGINSQPSGYFIGDLRHAHEKPIYKGGDFMKKKSKEIVGILVAAVMLAATPGSVGAQLPNVDKKGTVPVTTATKVALFHIKNYSQLEPLKAWKDAIVGKPKIYYKPYSEERSAYVFPVIKKNKNVGYITVSATVEKPPILEFSRAAPPSQQYKGNTSQGTEGRIPRS